VEQILAESLGRRVSIVSLKREPSPYATLFPAEVLSVELADGDRLTLFLKHLGQEQSDHPEKQCRDREVRVYQELLGEDDLPVVKYHGSRWNDATGRREVYLEYVDGWNLKYHDLEHWFTAARRLAHLHARFAGRAGQLLAGGFLLRFDEAYFGEWAERALSVVTGRLPRLGAELQAVTSRYERVTELLAGQPATLVHNDLAPKNVIADVSRSPARICFVDWEMAGVGCGLLDLVHLKYGLDPESDRTMREAYCDALAGTGLIPPDGRELGRLFAACEIHKTLYRLAFSTSWQLPAETVSQWVTETRRWFDGI